MNCEACGHANIEGARFCAKCGAVLATHDPGAEDPMIGQVVGGRYRVTGVLGEGGMGIVYVGEQQMGSTIRKVAIKTLHSHLSKDPSVLARFHRECGTVAQLEHPNTIKFYDFGATADGTLYIAMEFVKGQPLQEVIEKGGAMPPERVLKVMRQVCGALDEAHRLGIIHRDLKPDNIILTDRAGETDFVKVLDFGIAARTESADAQKEQKLTQQGMVLGTPPYMSPEQFTGKQLDARSDIYSLGVMVYEMLTGRLPFDADTPWQWATQHMTAQPLPFEVSAPASSINPSLRAAILKALSKNRDDRQESAKQFFAELSEGGGITVIDQPVVSSGARPPTAAMGAAPDFNAFGAAPPAAAPPGIPSGGGYGHAGTPAAMAAPVIAPPPIARGGGGGKGLLIGLGVLGGLLAIGIVVVAAKQLKPDNTDLTLTNPLTEAGGETNIAPELGDGSAMGQASPDAAAPEETAEKPDAAPKPTATVAKTSTTAQPVASTEKACDNCISAAQSGNILGASANYAKCADASKKSLCSLRAKQQAPSAARTAALNGNCKQAKAIQGAAQAMGAGSPGLSSALSGTKCQ
jgi:eukaryotic-like serine/threonine-protein kinase